MTNYAQQCRYRELYFTPNEMPRRHASFSGSLIDFSILADYEEVTTIEDGDEILRRSYSFSSGDTHMHTNRGIQNISGYDIFFENERRLDAYIAKLETECESVKAIPRRIAEKLSGELRWYLSRVNEKKTSQQSQLQKRLDGFYQMRVSMKRSFNGHRGSQEYQDFLTKKTSHERNPLF